MLVRPQAACGPYCYVNNEHTATSYGQLAAGKHAPLLLPLKALDGPPNARCGHAGSRGVAPFFGLHAPQDQPVLPAPSILIFPTGRRPRLP